jgi:hypothetical protein
VLIGSLFLKHLATVGSQNLLNALLGAILVTTASWQILYSFRPMRQNADARDRSSWLPWLMLPVGAEVGFSSAGAGALGSAALLSLTPLVPAQVVGTDIAFGFAVSLIGSGAHRRRRGRSHRRRPAEHPRAAPALALRTLGLASCAGRSIPFHQLSGLDHPQQTRGPPGDGCSTQVAERIGRRRAAAHLRMKIRCETARNFLLVRKGDHRGALSSKLTINITGFFSVDEARLFGANPATIAGMLDCR